MRLSALACGLALAAWVLSAANATAYDGRRPHAFRHADPGDIDYYALVLSWSPTHCQTEGHRRGDAQCDPDRAKDFVLHGFWPQYDYGWPEDCYRGRRPWIPANVIGDMQGIMPDKGIVIHEYTTHGTCSGLSPAAYFAAARKAYRQVVMNRKSVV